MNENFENNEFFQQLPEETRENHEIHLIVSGIVPDNGFDGFIIMRKNF